MKKQKDEKFVKFLARFIVESDAIESIKDDPRLVKIQLKENSQEGHVGALLLLENLVHVKERILTEDVVRKIQGLITKEQHKKPGGEMLPAEWIGKYRTINVRIGGRIAPLPMSVPELMIDWITRVENWQKTCQQSDVSNLPKIAKFHFEYELIHPFADGNGRSGRAIVFYLMRYCGLKPFIFSAADRFETYYCCFQNPEAMCQYFEKRYQK